MYRLSLVFFCFVLLGTSGCALIKPQTIEQKLMGIWAMEPSTKPKKGTANVIEYASDGTYVLHSFTCTGDGIYITEKNGKERGAWRIDDKTIVRTVTDSKNKEAIEKMVEEIRYDLSKMNEFEKTAALALLGPEKSKLLEGGKLESKEYIISIEDDVLISEEDWLMGMKIKSISHRASIIEPLCDGFN